MDGEAEGGGGGVFLFLGDEEMGRGFFLEAAARAPDMRASKAEGGGFDIMRRGNEKSREGGLREMRKDKGREKQGLKWNASINETMVRTGKMI